MNDSQVPLAVTIPLLNPNEPDGLLAALHVQEGGYVSAGQVLFTIETTKSTADVTAEQTGYVIGLRAEAGQTVRAGDLMCYLAGDPDWKPPEPDLPTSRDRNTTPDTALPAGLRITRPALTLAQQHGLDLSRLPAGTLVTESIVRQLLDAGQKLDFPSPIGQVDPAAIIVYGGGGHGKSVIDLLRLLSIYRITGIVDDGLPAGDSIMGVPLLGGVQILNELYMRGVRQAVNAVGGIGNQQTRLKVFEALAQAGFACPAIVHPSAVVEASAQISPAAQIFALSYVGSEASVGFGCIVNTGAILSHDCILGDYANISPGAILAGEVHIGPRALVGMGVTINLRVHVGAGARIGNGATVKGDVPENGIVRAGTIWPS